MKQQQQPEYMQQVTLYFEGVIEKAGVLLGETKEARPCLILTSDTHPFLSAVLKGDATVMKDAQRFIEWTTAAWIKGDRKNASGINVTVSEELKDKLAHKDEMPKFDHHRNVPITLQRSKPGEKYADNAAFLSVNFPSQEMLAMGGGQPKIIITRVAESEDRIGEILDEMARWVSMRLATMAAGA